MFDQDEELRELERYLADVQSWALKLRQDGRLSPEEDQMQFHRFTRARAALERIRERENDIEQVEMGDGFISSPEQLEAQRLARRMLKQQEEL